MVFKSNIHKNKSNIPKDTNNKCWNKEGETLAWDGMGWNENTSYEIHLTCASRRGQSFIREMR